MRRVAIDLNQFLKDNFGFDGFRPGQREIIEAVLAGRDALGVMPTGGGKSLTYQLPALLLDGLTIVVSPLIALMKDQVDAFNKRGKGTAIALHSNMSAQESSSAIAGLRGKTAALLYVAPERLELGRFAEFIRELGPKLLVIDEAHCVSMWGHDFRPSYLALGKLAQSLRPCPILALTATATPAARADIAQRLGMEKPLLYTGSFDRPNLRFDVIACSAKQKIEKLKELLRGSDGGSQIVYVGRRADADELTAMLKNNGLRGVCYHAGLKSDQRKKAQDQWLSGERPIAVATLAFGMGIDKPDVRTVIHYQHPASLEAYYQEAGRAGRDGKPARCALLFSGKDSSLAHFFIRNRYPTLEDIKLYLQDIDPTGNTQEQLSNAGPAKMTPEQRNVALLSFLEAGVVWRDERGLYCRSEALAKFIPLDTMYKRRDADYARLETMVGYARAACHRSVLLNYFGEKLAGDYRCGNCSACDGTVGTEEAAGRRKREKSAKRESEIAGPERDKVVAEITRLLLLHRETFAKLKFKMLRPVECFLRGAESKSVPEEWHLLEGHGQLGWMKQADLEPLVRQALIDNGFWKPKEEQAPDPKMQAVLDSGDVFWQSKKRAYTKTELLARQVPRERGLLILRAFANEPDGNAAGKIAGILNGHPMMAHDHPELQEHPFWKQAANIKYDEMLVDVLAMWCKGYLQPSEGHAKKLVVSATGQKALAAKKQPAAPGT